MSITQNDFAIACRSLRDAWLQIGVRHGSWDKVKLFEDLGSTYLRIWKQLENIPRDPGPRLADHHASADIEHEVAELDDEIVHKVDSPTGASINDSLEVVYDIVHSPSYQVPVLYLSVHGSSRNKHRSDLRRRLSNDVVNLLVPSLQQSALNSVGPTGALSMTDHPISGLPVYFVHPCRTNEAMLTVLADQSTGLVKPMAYLLRWFGLIGSSVGLNVPLDLATRLDADGNLL